MPGGQVLTTLARITLEGGQVLKESEKERLRRSEIFFDMRAP
jgi:hypothetical protein